MEIDGVEFVEGDRILLKGQTGPWWARLLRRGAERVGLRPRWLWDLTESRDNGIYVVGKVGCGSSPWEIER